MRLTMRLPVSRPLASALASAFFRRSVKKRADFSGQRALLTPHCLPMEYQYHSQYTHPAIAHPTKLTLSSASHAAGVPPHRNGFGLGGDIVEEGQGALQLHAVDCLRGLAGVLEGDTQVRTAGAGAFCARDFLSGVADLEGDGG